MMELSHSLTLNEEALALIAEPKRPIFVFEWLRFLDKVLVAAQKSDIRECQKKLVEQLTKLIHESPGPPTRQMISRCLSTLFSVGDTFLLFETVNKCNELLRNKDDSPSVLPARLSSICIIGAMYEKLGRMMGRSYEDTVGILLKSMRNAESQARIEVMNTLGKLCDGMGSAAALQHKDIYKVAKNCLVDRVMAVRSAASRCLMEMINVAPFLYSTELETLCSLCFRAFDGSSYDVRCDVAKLLGTLLARTQQPASKANTGITKVTKQVSLEDAMNILLNGFLKGGTGFLKSDVMKTGSGVAREVRIGITHAYVVFVQQMGGLWLERNMNQFLGHVLDLVTSPKAQTTHVDTVYSRKCVSFILRSVFGRMLGDMAQVAACKELTKIIIKHMAALDTSPENNKDSNSEGFLSQHVLVCSLQELGCLIQGLGTIAHPIIQDNSLGILDGVVSVMIHPFTASRLAAAWCLRSMCTSVPYHLTPLIDRCHTQIDKLKMSPEAIQGYSAALAALLGGVKDTSLGIPHDRGKVLFNVAEELLRSANQNSRLSLVRTQSGWLIVGSIMSLGSPVVRGLLPRMMLLWRNSFPRSTKELESEISRGDGFTWQVTLEGRAGALSSMRSFLLHCPDLATDDVIRRILNPIESAVVMMSNISSVIKSYRQMTQASATTVRLRLYQVLSLLPAVTFENSYTQLLRLLVADFTLGENPGNYTTSLLHVMCHNDDAIILGTWLQETDHKPIEDQLQPGCAAGSGTLEHDITCLYMPLPKDNVVPGPLPLGVSVIDTSVILFGQIFPLVANKHRLQMLDHFSECIKQVKSTRQEAVQMNIFSAILCGLKGIAETKSSPLQEDVIRAASNLILGCLGNSSPILRVGAGEALGRLAQVVGDSKFTTEMTQYCFDKLKSARDATSRTGHSLALGCLHRYVGSMGSSQHLNTSVSILLALAQDMNSPLVQVWALHAVALIADSGGPMFRPYVEPSLSLLLKLLLSVSPSNIDVHQCIGKCLSALITTIGPELQGNTNTISTARSSFLCACSIMQEHQDPLVQAEATRCLQQLHMFAPRHVNLSSLVPELCRHLCSRHLLLRRAAVSCLRQLAQREAREVCEHALTLVSENKAKDLGVVEYPVITESGLPGVLFSMLDLETDPIMVTDIHVILTTMAQSLAEKDLSYWLKLCKDVLTTGSDNLFNDGAKDAVGIDKEGDENDDVGDEEEFHAGVEPETHPTVPPRWSTRVFAIKCVQKIIEISENDRTNFDLAMARENQMIGNKADCLVLHLSDLVRMGFMAATSDSDDLRLEGLYTLQIIIDKFASVPEPEFPGHVILEQYQAQVGAALRPAFAPETPSHVTASACQVCSTWIGSGVARNLSDLRRIHHLLVSSLGKLKRGVTNQIYNESAMTLEKLSILKAWAEVYIVAMENMEVKHREASTESSRSDSDEESLSEETSLNDDRTEDNVKSDNLLHLVKPELLNLSKHWLAALKDHALLLLPVEFSSQLPHSGGAFYTTDTLEVSRQYYRSSWASILHAAALWLNNGGFDNVQNERSEINVSGCSNLGLGPANASSSKSPNEINRDRFYLIYGICMEALCNPRTTEPVENILTCLEATYTILDSSFPRSLLGENSQLSVELCNVLHRLLLTRDNPDAHLKAVRVIQQVVRAAQETLGLLKKKKIKELMPANQEPQDCPECDLLGEGGESGEIEAGKSVVFAIMEVCLNILVRHLPSLNPSLTTSSSLQYKPKATYCLLAAPVSKLLGSTLELLEQLPSLCSPAGAIELFPSVLHLTLGVLKELGCKNPEDETVLANTYPISKSLHCLKVLISHEYSRDPRCEEKWKTLLQSALAKLLDQAKTVDELKADEVMIMLAIAMFALHGSKSVLYVPNLLYPSINQFQSNIQSPSLIVRMKCVQTLKSIFAHNCPETSYPFIHALAPRLLDFLKSNESRNVMTEQECQMTIETISTVEVLVNICTSKHRKDILGLLVPIMITYLLDPNEINAVNIHRRNLHEYTLQKLILLGPQYPMEFRSIMAKSSGLVSRLEGAIKSNKDNPESKRTEAKPITTHVPTIKLKMDFSNFS